MEEIKKISAILTLKSDEFNKSISDVNKELKLAQAEVQNSDAKLKVYGKSMDTLQTKHDTLQSKINSLKDKTNLYTESINKNNEKLIKNREDLDNLAKKKDELNKKYNETIKLYGKESEQARSLKGDLDNLKNEYREKENQIKNNINTINNHNEKLVKTETELVKTQAELKNTSKELDDLSKRFTIAGKSSEEISTKFKDVGSKLNDVGNNILKFTAPLAVLGAGALKVGVDFESAMSNVSAISGATGEELEKLGEKAKEMGANTSKSATESADAMSYMALAGWDSTQIISGIEPVLRLAEAGNLDLARASDLVTDSMSALGLEVSELPQFLDKVAKSSATSNTSIDQLMEAFLIVGGKANSLGVNLDELSTVLGVMANRGIKGAEAGRGLSAILTNLTAPTGQAEKALEALGLTAFDGQGNFIGLENVIKNLSRSTENLTQEEKNLYLSQIAGKEHAKTLNAIMASLTEEYEGLKSGINSADGALEKMASTMQDNTKGGLTKLKSQLEGLGIQFAEHLLPHVNRLIDGVSKLLDWFANLGEGTQKTIVNIGLLSFGIGGLLKVAGGLSSGIGSIIGLVGKLTPLLGGLTGGVGLFSGSIAGIGTAFLGALAPIAPFALAIGGVAVAGYAVNKCLSQDVIPTVDLFANKIEYINTGFTGYGATYQTVTTTISDATKTAVSAYMELDTQATNTLMSMSYGYSEVSRISSESLNEMSASFFENILAVGEGSEELKEKLIAEFNSALNGINVTTGEGLDEVVTMFAQQYFEVEAVTEDMKNQVIEMFNLTKLETTSTTQTLGEELVSIFSEMGNKINTEMSTKREEDLASLKDFLENSKLITQEEYTTMVEQTNTAYDTKKQTVEDIQNQIKEILTRAKDEHRALTEEEVLSIAELQSKMKENAIRILSQNEVEANVILERMKANDARVTAEQAGEHIKKLNEQRDGAIKAAEEEYNKVLASIVRMRDETGVVTSEQANKMIEEATRQKDETIKKAEETRESAVNTILGMNEDLKDSVNSTTGEIMTWWDKLKNWWDGWFPSKKTFETETIEVTVQRTVYESSGGNVQANALGTNYFQGGLTKINERGFELVELPRGSKIFNNDASERYIQRAVEELVSKFNNNNQAQTINIYSPRPLNAYEISKQLKRQQRELLLGRYI